MLLALFASVAVVRPCLRTRPKCPAERRAVTPVRGQRDGWDGWDGSRRRLPTRPSASDRDHSESGTLCSTHAIGPIAGIGNLPDTVTEGRDGEPPGLVMKELSLVGAFGLAIGATIVSESRMHTAAEMDAAAATFFEKQAREIPRPYGSGW